MLSVKEKESPRMEIHYEELSDPQTLTDWAVKIITTSDPTEKCRLTHLVESMWKAGQITRVKFQF